MRFAHDACEWNKVSPIRTVGADIIRPQAHETELPVGWSQLPTWIVGVDE